MKRRGPPLRKILWPVALAVLLWPLLPSIRQGIDAAGAPTPDRSPVDLVFTQDEKWLLTANQTAGTVSLVHVVTGEVVSEVPCGKRPTAIALTPDGRTVLVSATFAGELAFLRREERGLCLDASLYLGFEPRGIAVSPDGAL